MSVTTKPNKPRQSLPVAGEVPRGLEWLASVAERDYERIREKIVQEAIERHKQERKPKSPK